MIKGIGLRPIIFSVNCYIATILAMALALGPKAGTNTGMIMKGMTIALLLSGPLLNEGFICILMAAPLFYLVGAIIGWSMDRGRRRPDQQPRIPLILIPLLVASTEGLVPATTLPADNTASAERTVATSAVAVERKLAQAPDFNRELISSGPVLCNATRVIAPTIMRTIL